MYKVTCSYLLLFMTAVASLEAKPLKLWEHMKTRPYDSGANEALLRHSYASYPESSDGEWIDDEPNARVVSNMLGAQDNSIPNSRHLSSAVWAWGQFLDHDISLTGTSSENGTADIQITDETDPMGPYLPFDRSNYACSHHAGRDQINQITPYIDASNVYGSSEERALALRTGEGGMLKTSEGELLPYNWEGLDNAGGPSPQLFVGGDVRANENVLLTSLHTLFVREHNRLARKIARRAPAATDEQIYQLARKIVGAEMQIITYREFLPALLGRFAPKPRKRSRHAPHSNPQIANEFSSALYRFGHSMLGPYLALDGQGALPLREAFFNPGFLGSDPSRVDALLGGMSQMYAEEVDCQVIDDVRNFLFQGPGGGLDLLALNIQRGRDHGIPPYNELRIAYGLAPAADFTDVSDDPEIQAALAEVYANVEEIDAWIGAMAEGHVRGTSVGRLLLVGLREQFIRLRDGDPFFYTRDKDLRRPFVRRIIKLEKVSLSKVIRRNTNASVSRKPFYVD